MMGNIFIVNIPPPVASIPQAPAPNPVVEGIGAMSPLTKVMGVANLLFGVISGYELGNTTVAKMRGHWNPGFARPVTALVVAVATTILISGTASLGIFAAAAATGFAIGATRAMARKAPPKQEVFSNFAEYQNEFGARPESCAIAPVELTKKGPWDKNLAASLVWRMMEKACENGEGFTNGTFVLEQGAEVVYENLKNIEGAYSRHSSHFNGRIADGTVQMGLDFFPDDPALPANRRTILFGLATTHDGEKVLFVKPETWGADHRASSLFGSYNKAKHFVMHALSFAHAQYVKKVRPGYDDQATMRKERIPKAWLQDVKQKAASNELPEDALNPFQTFGLASIKSQADRQKISTLPGSYRTGREAYIQSLV